jgi:asparagine synthase (glutamine-hydrolysing)
MNRVELGSPAWARAGTSQARGYAHLDGRFCAAGELATALDRTATDSAWIETIGRLNGCFAVVTQRDGLVLAAVDRIRSIPLFYRFDKLDVHLSDSAYRVLPAGPGTVDTNAATEFCLTGYVTGPETLCAGVLQLEAGEIIRVEPSRALAPERHRYHRFRHGDFLAADIADLIARLENVHTGVFRRLVNSIGGRTIVVPLSGGYDSRLIGVSLRDLGISDVVCYSYGVPGNWESRTSQELARYLGFRWEFVPYSAERWRAWATSDRFAEYFHDAGNLVSVPHIQDWPAVFELQRDARVPPDSVFVPGHSGDFLAGSHIPKSFVGRTTIARRELLDSLQSAHYSLWDWPAATKGKLRHEFDRRIESIIGRIDDGSREHAADAFERWDLQERQAKFICNSVRAYESFGFDWRLPLFDHELMDFWARIPVDLRLGRALYFEFARQRQALPVTPPNRDHGAVVDALIRAIDRAGLRHTAKRTQRALRRLRWRSVRAKSPLAWLELIDADEFRRTYTGNELMHSYLALRYRDHAAKAIGASPRA